MRRNVAALLRHFDVYVTSENGSDFCLAGSATWRPTNGAASRGRTSLLSTFSSRYCIPQTAPGQKPSMRSLLRRLCLGPGSGIVLGLLGRHMVPDDTTSGCARHGVSFAHEMAADAADRSTFKAARRVSLTCHTCNRDNADDQCFHLHLYSL